MFHQGVRLSAVLAAGLLLHCTHLSAQGYYATVTGVATGALGGVVPQVRVTITNVDTSIERTVLTSEADDFTVTNLVPGSYDLKAELEGFRSYVKSGIVLEVGTTCAPGAWAPSSTTISS